MKKQIICYIKTAILSGSVGILAFCVMLYGRVDDLTAFFWSVVIYATFYFGILSIIDKSPRERQLPGRDIIKQKNQFQYNTRSEKIKMYTDNPVSDMENYEHKVAEENARRDIFGYCEQCGNAIYRATDEEYGDEYVSLTDGTFIHYDCVRGWANERKKEAH